MNIRPKNWADFQHYKDRSPTWIKLHKDLLDNYEFQCLPVASRALAPMLWLLASEEKDGTIDATPAKLAFRLRMTTDEVVAALKPLIDGLFFEVTDGASGLLAEPERVASSEKRTSKTQDQTQVQEIARSADADDDAAVLEAFNSVAEELGWSKAQRVTPARKTTIRARLRECGGVEGWRAAMAKARASPFLRGETGRDKAHANWTPDLDFFLQQSTFTKLMEGKYDQRDSNSEPSGLAAAIAGARAVVAGPPNDASVQRSPSGPVPGTHRITGPDAGRA